MLHARDAQAVAKAGLSAETMYAYSTCSYVGVPSWDQRFQAGFAGTLQGLLWASLDACWPRAPAVLIPDRSSAAALLGCGFLVLAPGLSAVRYFLLRLGSLMFRSTEYIYSCRETCN